MIAGASKDKALDWLIMIIGGDVRGLLDRGFQGDGSGADVIMAAPAQNRNTSRRLNEVRNLYVSDFF